MNITHTTHIKPVSTLVPVTGIGLSSHYVAFLPSSCVLSHIAALPPTKQHAFSSSFQLHTPCGRGDLSLHLAQGHGSAFADNISQVKLSLCVCVKLTSPRHGPLAIGRAGAEQLRLGGHLQAMAAPEDVLWLLWLLAQPIICHHHPRRSLLMSACKSQQLRNQHTFASAVSPPWWLFLAQRQRGQLEVAASQTTLACSARLYHLCTERTPAKVVAWLYNFACG